MLEGGRRFVRGKRQIECQKIHARYIQPLTPKSKPNRNQALTLNYLPRLTSASTAIKVAADLLAARLKLPEEIPVTAQPYQSNSLSTESMVPSSTFYTNT